MIVSTLNLMQDNPKELVTFDVDGTLIDGQSQSIFLKYLLARGYVSHSFFLKLWPWFILYKMGLVKDPRKPMEYAYSFLRGRSVSEIADIAHDFFESTLQGLLYATAVDVIRKHQSDGREVMLISNTTDIIIKEIAQHLGVSSFACTTLEIEGGHYTGKVIQIMYGSQKVEAVRRLLNERHSKNTWAYSDHVSDLELLSLAEHPVAVNPTPALSRAARKRGWTVVSFRGSRE